MCEACTHTLPCREHYLTFGALNGTVDNIRKVTGIALTNFLCLEQSGNCSASNSMTSTDPPNAIYNTNTSLSSLLASVCPSISSTDTNSSLTADPGSLETHITEITPPPLLVTEMETQTSVPPPPQLLMTETRVKEKVQ